MKTPNLLKGLIILNVSLGIGVLGGHTARANDLVNGNLDITEISSQSLATPTGWTVESFQLFSGLEIDGCSSETFCNVEGPGGKGLFFKPFKGTPDDPVTVHFYQDNPAAEGAKYTFSGYAAAEANYSGFLTTNDPPPATLFVVQFLDASSLVIASNAYDLVAAGLPNSGPGSMTKMTMPEVTAPAGTVTVRSGASMINCYSTTGAQSFFVDVFDLESVAPPGAPDITNQPSHTTVSPGDTATFTVGISNPSGVTYQWQFYGTNISDGGNISGTTTDTLTISNVSSNNVGHYRVKAENAQGFVFSSEATLAIVDIHFFPVISIEGKIGDVYRVDYATQVAPEMFMPLSTNVLNSSPQLILDSTAPVPNERFYRAIYLP